MIAKSTALVLLFCGTFSLFGQNKYVRILEEYDVHPPDLEYGYPWWYQYDSLPITSVIFLKKDLAVTLNKLDSITYVAELTKENAMEIFNFSGEKGERPLFYIVPDSSLEWREVKDFVETLVPKYWEATILFCGSRGKYCPVLFDENSPQCGDNLFYQPMGCGPPRNIVQVLTNARNEILVESRFVAVDSLYKEIFSAYTHDYLNPGDSYKEFYRDAITEKECEKRITSLQNWMDKTDDPGFLELYTLDIKKWKALLEITRRYGDLVLLPPNAQVRLRFMPGSLGVNEYYEKLNQVSKGVYYSREWRARQLSRQTYFDLLRNKQTARLGYIHIEFPDLLYYEFSEGGYEDEIAPPPLPEVLILEDDSRSEPPPMPKMILAGDVDL